MKKTILALAVGLAITAGIARAGETPAAGAPEAASGVELSEAPVEPALNVELGSPLVVSANLGIRVRLGEPGSGRGLLLQVQPGLGGGAVNIGFVPISFYAQGTQAIAVGVKARLLRTWGSPWGTEAGHSYAGFEAGVAVGVKLAAGVLWKLDSSQGGSDRIVTWSVGIGL